MPNLDNARSCWTGDGVFATPLLILFYDRYGSEGLEWSPQTIREQIAHDFGVEITAANLGRLMAAITVLTGDEFYKNLNGFIRLCLVLSGDDADPETFVPADATDCAWGITEAVLIHPPEEDEPFTDEIRYYLGAVLKNEGFVRPPDVLKIALTDDDWQVEEDWSADAVMVQAIFKNQSDKADEVTQTIQDNISRLMAQVARLPLENGNAESIISRLPQHLRAV